VYTWSTRLICAALGSWGRRFESGQAHHLFTRNGSQGERLSRLFDHPQDLRHRLLPVDMGQVMSGSCSHEFYPHFIRVFDIRSALVAKTNRSKHGCNVQPSATRFGYKRSKEMPELSSVRFAISRRSHDHDCSFGITRFADSTPCVRPFATLTIFRVHGLPVEFATEFVQTSRTCSSPPRSLATLRRYVLDRETLENTT
jgi:hypothetical protein